MEGLNLFESNILLWIQENLRIDALDSLMLLVSAVNNAGILSILVVTLLLLLRRYRPVGVTAFFSLAIEFLLVNLTIKNVVARVRPYIVNEKLLLLGHVPYDYSFPSGHSGAAFAVAVVPFVCGRDGAIPNKCGVFALAAAFLIALSRLYNAAHYPTDVLVGILIGTVTSILAYKYIYLRWFKRKLGD
ncbi:MAG: phosphatase PAP2 family protein [Lachnospiraceae bacterium]|nr:phosphatase PAP2 family protein [Lachnospiraceae bacterium]